MPEDQQLMDQIYASVERRSQPAADSGGVGPAR